ncbi:MAG: hypothetical protein FJ315_06035 [SAR202 cluster bacterium]|nr:hypothetical protein [SAR202 cluster bacterium]
MTDRKLPEGWRWVRLGQVVAEAQLGFATSERDPKGIIQLRMNNVTTRGQFDWTSFIRVPADTATREAYEIRPGDVLFNNTNSTVLVGKTAIFSGYGEPVVFSNHFTRLRTIPDQLIPGYLASWLQAQWQEGLFQQICNRWIGQSAVQREKLLHLTIPLPPLAEQRRIVAVLNEQMAAVERARAAAQARSEAAKALPAAYLRAVFNSTEAQHWPRRRLGNVCDINPRRPEIRRSDDAPTTFVPMAAVQDGGRGIAAPEQKPFGILKKGYTFFREGDILFAKITPCMQNGKHAVACNLSDGIGFGSTEFHVVHPGHDVVPEWIHSFFLQPQVLEAAKASFVGMVGQQRVPDDFLASLTLPLPSLAEQRRIVAILNEQMVAVERARAAAQAQLEAISSLPAALLRRAFSGGL